jgi:rhodanese-related sulfurtransferase
MSGSAEQGWVRDLTPEEVARGMREGRILLVDVREPNETAIERFPDAVIVPMSAFDPVAIPDPQNPEMKPVFRMGLGQSLLHVRGADSLSWEIRDPSWTDAVRLNGVPDAVRMLEQAASL